MENFAHIYEQIADSVLVGTVIVSSPGELLGMKGHLVNWVARNVKKMIPQ
jgi:long-chain acyl-CoA synthetase